MITTWLRQSPLRPLTRWVQCTGTHRGLSNLLPTKRMLRGTLPAELKHARGLEPGGIRLSVGLEDWHDIINELEIALEQM